jgi:hypothetical protein
VNFNLRKESIRGLRVIVHQNSDNRYCDDAAKRASARHITAVIPYFDGLDRIETKPVPIEQTNSNC